MENESIVLGDHEVVRRVGDLKFVPTPTTRRHWENGGWIDTIKNELRAHLYDGKPKLATLLKNNAYGEPFVKTVHLVRVYVGPHAQHEKAVHIDFLAPRPRERKLRLNYFQPTPFSGTFVMIAWGEWSVNLNGLMQPREPILWHDGTALAAQWLEARRRFLESANVWLDTVEQALEWHREKYPDRYAVAAIVDGSDR